jgi:Mg2+-importing ATPase
MPPLQVLRRLESSPRGLEEDDAQARLARYGDNVQPGSRLPHWAIGLARSGRSPFVIVLLCLAAVSALIGEPSTAAVIAMLAVASCLLKFGRERGSDKAAAGLQAMVATTATVVRRACAASPPVAREVPVDQLVPGDIVRLAPGDIVPADMRLLRSADLAVGEALLTGESLPAAKHPAERPSGWASQTHHSPHEAPLGRPELCLMGSTVASGSGTGIVVATGAATYVAAACRNPSRHEARTAFDRGVRGVSWMLIGCMLVCVPLVLAVSAGIRGDEAGALLFAVSVAVGLTPEMLPVVVTTALARGARVMAPRGVVVRRLAAMHNLGAMDVLCTDKTGTLTEGRPSVDCCIDPAGLPDSEVLGWACENAHWQAECTGEPIANVLDEALLQHADMSGISAGQGFAGVDVIPFDPVRRRVTVVVRHPGRAGQHILITKGAVEDVLGCCARARMPGRDVWLSPPERVRLAGLAESLATAGTRLLAVAVAERPARASRYRQADEAGLTLVGFVGFRDVTRASVPDALAALAGRHVTVKVVTGDDPLTAARICQEAGIKAGPVVLGRDIDALGETALASLATGASVFARVSPDQKARIVRALRSAGHTVGFLGDGVNDTAALRCADVGISAAGAARAARESAEVILAGKDLAVLGQAVMAGRRTFGNVVKYLKITVSSNFGNVASLIAVGAVLPFLPMLPSQILVQNLCFDVSQLAIAYDRVEDDATDRPHTFDVRDLGRFVVCLGLVNTLADLATFAVLWRITGGRHLAAPVRAGWFTENLVSQALTVHLLRSRGRPSARNHASRPVLLATAAIAAIGLGLPLTPLAAPLGMSAPPAVYYPLLAVVLAGYCATVATVKPLYQRVCSRWL